jgi:hypothetical protein
MLARIYQSVRYAWQIPVLETAMWCEPDQRQRINAVAMN